MENPRRAVAFIDGFNVYHYLANNFPKMKWLDYWKLALCHIPQYATLIGVHYFSAYATWNQRKTERHQDYVEALESVGVTPHINHFVNRRHEFIVEDPNATRVWDTVDGQKKGRLIHGYRYEEKQTDVGIATTIIAMASRDEFDIALLISGDTDFVPVFKSMQEYFSNKQMRAAVPAAKVPAPYNHLLRPGYCRLIKGSQLEKCQLPDPVILRSGFPIPKPDAWK